MLRHFAAALLAATLAMPAAAQQDAIEGVIRDQITAFRADDFATAFAYASPGIRQMFQTPERFGAMVRQGYPMVWRPEDVQFLELERMGPRQVQKVLIRDGSGALHMLAYYMVEREDGWRIDGVQILQAPEVGA